MKKYLTLLGILFIHSFSIAQFVTINDQQFQYYIQVNFPACINGNQLDTTCADVLNATEINFLLYDVADITGIKYFKGLKKLDLSENHFIHSITELPDSLETLILRGNYFLSNIQVPLPAGLKRLNTENSPFGILPSLPNTLINLSCSYSSLNTLSPLPATIDTLICDGNHLSTIPSLPSTMTYLACWNNPLNSQLTLPDSLHYLDCSLNNQILTTLPTKLQYLNCGYNQMNVLPVLPSTLETLFTVYNNLTQLPALPVGLRKLGCQLNHLTSLPPLPDSLRWLSCDDNSIGSLPSLPQNLNTLSCNSNQLNTLPVLNDSLVDFSCCDNSITTLPALPAGLKNLKCSSNNISTLPALPTTLELLNCNVNHLTMLPAFPPTLQFLNCSYNQLNDLPQLNSILRSLKINNNPGIKCLPMTDTLSFIFSDSVDITHTGIQCLPYPLIYFGFYPIPSIDTLPSCNVYNPDSCTSTIGITETDKFHFTVYPNPFSDLTTVTNSSSQYESISITDATGRLVFKISTPSQTNKTELDLSYLPSGLYILTLNSKGTHSQQKLLKK